MNQELIRTNRVEGLPPLPPIEFFGDKPGDSFYFKVARAFYEVTDDPDRAELVDQVPFVVESLTKQELFDLAGRMYTEFPDAQDEEGEKVTLWGNSPKDLDFDSTTERVFLKDGKSGSSDWHLGDIALFIRKYYVPDKGAPEQKATSFLIHLLDEKMADAFDNYYGKADHDAGEKAVETIKRESDRRKSLPMKVLSKDEPIHKANERVVRAAHRALLSRLLPEFPDKDDNSDYS